MLSILLAAWKLKPYNITVFLFKFRRQAMSYISALLLLLVFESRYCKNWFSIPGILGFRRKYFGSSEIFSELTLVTKCKVCKWGATQIETINISSMSLDLLSITATAVWLLNQNTNSPKFLPSLLENDFHTTRRVLHYRGHARGIPKGLMENIGSSESLISFYLSQIPSTR